MGNTFTMFSGNDHFDMITAIENGIYAFAIVGLTSQFTYSANGPNWEGVDGSYEDSGTKYTYIFRYKPGGVRTLRDAPSPGAFAFTRLSGTAPPSDSDVHWVNGTTSAYDGDPNSGTPFSGVMYNQEHTSTDAGSGSGDPHIIPLYNPEGKIYVLETNNDIYKYFDNLDPEQRIVINTKMWVLDNRFIYIVQLLQKMNSKYYKEANDQITNFKVDDCYTPIDTSFAKYTSIMVKTKTSTEFIIIDTETLLPVIYTDSDKLDNEVKNYSLQDTTLDNLNLQHINVGEIKHYNNRLFNIDKIILRRPRKDTFYRDITIDSNKHGLLTIRFIRIHSKPNHRNHVELKFERPEKVNYNNCCGTIIKLNQREIVPSLLHINESLKVNTIDEPLLTTEEWKVQRAKVIDADRKEKGIKRGEDFYCEVNKDPELAYKQMINK